MARQKARQFKRRLVGYRRRDVDAHLASIDDQIANLQTTLETREAVHADLVLRATRQAVEEVMSDAHAEADRIRANAREDAEQFADRSVIDLTAGEAGEESGAELFSGDDEVVGEQA